MKSVNVEFVVKLKLTETCPNTLVGSNGFAAAANVVNENINRNNTKNLRKLIFSHHTAAPASVTDSPIRIETYSQTFFASKCLSAHFFSLMLITPTQTRFRFWLPLST